MSAEEGSEALEEHYCSDGKKYTNNNGNDVPVPPERSFLFFSGGAIELRSVDLYKRGIHL